MVSKTRLLRDFLPSINSIHLSRASTIQICPVSRHEFRSRSSNECFYSPISVFILKLSPPHFVCQSCNNNLIFPNILIILLYIRPENSLLSFIFLRLFLFLSGLFLCFLFTLCYYTAHDWSLYNFSLFFSLILVLRDPKKKVLSSCEYVHLHTIYEKQHLH